MCKQEKNDVQLWTKILRAHLLFRGKPSAKKTSRKDRQTKILLSDRCTVSDIFFLTFVESFQMEATQKYDVTPNGNSCLCVTSYFLRYVHL